MSSRRYHASREAISETTWKKMLRHEALCDQNGRCGYCLTPMRHAEATAEHKHPRSKGGATNRHNIAASCEPCNRVKADMPHGEFLTLIDRRAMPRGVSLAVIMIWSSRRIFKCAQASCVRIERSVR